MEPLAELVTMSTDGTVPYGNGTVLHCRLQFVCKGLFSEITVYRYWTYALDHQIQSVPMVLYHRLRSARSCSGTQHLEFGI
jgi:hypothetical protein